MLPYSFVFAYRMGLGDFITDEFSGSRSEVLVWVLWFANTLVINIILLNLLIAIMGDTFDRVLETSEASMLKEISTLMHDYEFVFDRQREWEKAKYIIAVSEEHAEHSQTSWEGRLSAMKDLIHKNTVDLKA